MTGAPLLLLFSLVLAPARAAEPAASSQTVRVIYADRPGNFSVSFGSLGAVDKALRAGAGGARRETSGIFEGYVAGEEFAFDGALSVPPAGAAAQEGSLEALETGKELLFVEPAVPGLMAEVGRLMADPSDERLYSPDVRASTVTLRRFQDGARSVLVSGAAPGARWEPTAGFRYRLTVSGRPATLYVIGRLLGGPGVVSALQERMAAPGPALRLLTGGVYDDPQFGLEHDYTLKRAQAMGFEVLAFEGNDFGHYFAGMARLLSRPGSTTRLLCTNLKTTGPDAPDVERAHVAELGGVRVAVLSVIPAGPARAAVERLKLPVTVEDPIPAVRDAVRELRGKRRADAVVLVSQLDMADEGRLMEQTDGVDVVISGGERLVSSRREAAVDLTDWSREQHWRPALHAGNAGNSFAELALRFEGRELRRIEEHPGPVVAEAAGPTPFDDEARLLLMAYLRPSGPLLPDPRALWPDVPFEKTTYLSPEFWDMAAAALRRRAGAEVSLLRITYLNSNPPGAPQEAFVREWIGAGVRPVTAQVSGRALLSLLDRLVLPGRPMTLDELEPNFGAKVWLAASGLDAKGRVSGVPIDPNETYTVATTEELLSRVDELPGLKGAAGARPLGNDLADLLVDQFQRDRGLAPAAWRDAAEGRTPPGLSWRLDLRELSLQFSDTQVSNNTAFTQVRDARIQSTSQVLEQGAGKFFSELDRGRLGWDAGVTAQYGRVTIKPPGGPDIVNTTEDQVVFESELRHRTWAMAGPGLRPGVGPFGNVSYETQFQPPPGTPKAQFLRWRAGLEAADGLVVRKAYAGPAGETDYSESHPRTHFGYAGGLTASSPIRGGPAQAQLEASYLELFSNGDDRPQDLRRRLKARLSMSVPVMKDLSLAPFLDYYLFQGLTVRQTGRSVFFGVSLSFARLWKPFFY